MKTHITVFRDEAIEALAINEASHVVDVTIGSAGHASAICARLGTSGIFIGLDADPNAIEKAHDILKTSEPKIHLAVSNFRNIDSVLQDFELEHVDAILADLGWRMEQFSGNGKGFSFQVDEPLIMTYGDPSSYPFVAKDILNEWSIEDIKNVLKGYGEERYAYKIAHAIVKRRDAFQIETTKDLVSIIESSVPHVYRYGRIHPATRTFQALRIAVNDELEALEILIRKSMTLLNNNGRLAIITFHSIEDRIVKKLFKEYEHDHHGVVCTKKPIQPNEGELEQNPRARSAKLRIFEKHAKV